MLNVDKNNFNKWELLLQVLSEEMSESDARFQEWLQEDEENRMLYRSLKGEGPEDERFDKDRVFGNISEILSFEQKKRVFIKKRWLGYVAGIALLIAAGWMIESQMEEEATPRQIAEVQTPEVVVEPGTKKAFLQSSQGESIDLSETFQIENEDGTVISNNTQGVVSFEKNNEKVKEVERHTICVPKGGEYELLLADGSRVHLNSETQLTFPSYFDGETRTVELTGEAFFEVKKSTKPFIVQTASMHVEVLGTTFNVSAYRNEMFTNTTLVEGSVQVYTQNEANPYRLAPGHNLHTDKLSNEVSIQKVNTDLFTAWVKGEFMFRNEPLCDIFAQLSRWYDFTVDYEDISIKEMKFTGSAEKARSLDYLLTLIESVTDIKYKYEGNHIRLYK